MLLKYFQRRRLKKLKHKAKTEEAKMKLKRMQSRFEYLSKLIASLEKAE